MPYLVSRRDAAERLERGHVREGAVPDVREKQRNKDTFQEASLHLLQKQKAGSSTQHDTHAFAIKDFMSAGRRQQDLELAAHRDQETLPPFEACLEQQASSPGPMKGLQCRQRH